MILESNEDLDSMIKYLDSKVIELKKKYPNSQLLKDVGEFYKSVLDSWMWDFRMDGKEVENEYDEELKNLILEWITKINNVLKK